MTDETKDDFAALFDEDFMQMMAGRECVCVLQTAFCCVCCNLILILDLLQCLFAMKNCMVNLFV